MAITIINQPISFAGAIGETFGFRVDTAEQGSSYKWQYSASGVSGWAYTAAGSENESNNTPFLHDLITEARNGMYYRCRIIDSEGKYHYSQGAQLVVGTTPPVQKQLVRLWMAKANIITAISGKGITVPTNADFDDFPALIAQIGTT